MLDDRPSTTTPPSAATLFVALDLSRSSWVVAVHAPHTGKVSRHKLPPGAEGLLALVGRLREQAERALGAPVRGASSPHAGRGGVSPQPRGRPRRVLAAPGAARGRDREPGDRPGLAPGRPPGAAGEDRPAGRRGGAAGGGGPVARRGAGGGPGGGP